MTTDQFVEKYLGKKIDFDNAYAGQCVDLFRQYVQEVLGFPQPKGVSGAKDFWLNFDTDPNLKNNYTKIPNTPDAVPQKGDVMLWNGKAGGGFGHVSIFLTGDVNSFTSFDQNWPTLSVCTKTVHDYKNVSGWLRPLQVTPPTEKTYTQAEWKIERDARNENWNLYRAQLIKTDEISNQLKITQQQLSQEQDHHTKDLESIAVILDVKSDMATILPAINTAITFEDKANEYQGLLKDEQDKRAQDLIAWEKRLGDLQKQLDNATSEIDRLKKLPPISSTPDTAQSLLERIKQFFLKN